MKEDAGVRCRQRTEPRGSPESRPPPPKQGRKPPESYTRQRLSAKGTPKPRGPGFWGPLPPSSLNLKGVPARQTLQGQRWSTNPDGETHVPQPRHCRTEAAAGPASFSAGSGGGTSADRLGRTPSRGDRLAVRGRRRQSVPGRITYWLRIFDSFRISLKVGNGAPHPRTNGLDVFSHLSACCASPHVGTS